MLDTNHFNFYFEISKDWEKKMLNIANDPKAFLDLDQVIQKSWISKKQIDLFLYRHKEVPRKNYTIKDWFGTRKIKLVHVSIIEYVLRNAKRIAKAKK